MAAQAQAPAPDRITSLTTKWCFESANTTMQTSETVAISHQHHPGWSKGVRMTRLSIAKQRAALFGGRVADHCHDAGRGGTLGIDECSDSQREMRVALALALLEDTARVYRWTWHRLWSYKLSVTPRYDSLDFTSSAAENIVQAICGGYEPLPGFRFVGASEGRASLQHIPSGGLLTVAAERPPFIGDPALYRRDRGLGLSEKAAAARGTLVSDDAKQLLAALIARLSINLGDGGYGHLLDHHTGTPGTQRNTDHLQLTGAHDDWLLTASQTPHLDHLVLALTKPPHGLAQCVPEWHGPDNVVMRYRTASLAVSALDSLRAERWAQQAVC